MVRGSFIHPCSDTTSRLARPIAYSDSVTLPRIMITYHLYHSNVYWIDTAIPLEKFLELKRFQVSVLN